MSDSEDDWFNKDENEILQNLEHKLQQQEHFGNELHIEEHIEFCSRADDYLRQVSLETDIADNGAKKAGRFTTAEFANALKMTSLDMFLYFMSEGRDLFVGQLTAKDSQKRVLQYLEILTMLCKMELGGFDEQLLSGFASQTVLFEHIKRFALKLFMPPSKGCLDVDAEVILRSSKWLLIRAHKLGVLSELGYGLIEHFKTLLARCQLPQLLKHPLCLELAQELQVLPTVNNVKSEIYPKLENLLESEPIVEASIPSAGNVAEYINYHRRLLCEDFLQPLREFVQRLRIKSQADALLAQNLLWQNTELVLNPEFADAERHSLIFMDLRPAARSECFEESRINLATLSQRAYLQSLKTGTMLCFTTSFDFDNLILATVGYTESKSLRQGYISVEIAKQYNIGNIYNKPLIMFEAPVFFEPYLRVHNYLSTCSADNFPMRRYIVEGQLEVQAPAFIRPDRELMHKEKTNFNDQQRAALGAALSNEFCLIQGPPGTGKTHLSVELVNVLLENAEHLKTGPIIVLTYTNDSLDKFLLKIAKHTDSILRFGCQSRLPQIEKYNMHGMVDDQLVPPRLKRVWWLIKHEYKEQFERLQALHADFDGTEKAYEQIQRAQSQLQLVAEKLNTLRIIFQYYLARDKSVLAMTTTCAARLNFLFRLLPSKCVVFEEAAEIAESHVLACLTPYTDHAIFIGDHKQLQPYTGNYTQQGLQVSLFERLINQGFPVTVLNVQYRMRSCIADLLVPSFYEKLISDDSVNAFADLQGIANNLYFVNHTHPEEHLTDMSFVNVHEAEELVKLALSLKCKASDIVILSPYNAQVEHIKLLLRKKKHPDILVASVDSYQGLEANIVLLSLVRSNETGQIGFLRQPNRVCVALSRARWALYIMGNVETLERGNYELWGKIISKLRAANAVGEAFPISVPEPVEKSRRRKPKAKLSKE